MEVMFPIAIRSRNGGRLNPPLHHPRISPSQSRSGNQAGQVPGPSLIDSDGASSGEYGSLQAARLLDPLNGSAGYPVLGSESAKG